MGVTEDLTARASWSTGFRAPSLAQIGLGPSQASSFITDKYLCAANGPNHPDGTCRPLDFKSAFSGNPDLEAEESETWNIGMIWAPTQQFDIGFDVFSIVQDNKIDKLQLSDIYNANCNDQNSSVCKRFTPEPGKTFGDINEIESSFVNLGSQEVQGMDISAHYGLGLDQYGDVKFGLEWSYMHNFEKEINGETVDYTGEYKYPKNRWLATTNWMMDDLAANVNLSYIGEFEDFNKTRTVDEQLLVDMSGSYRFNDTIKLSVGVNNVFDEEPSFAIGDEDGDFYGYVTSVHNPMGRYVYTKVTFNF